MTTLLHRLAARFGRRPLVDRPFFWVEHSVWLWVLLGLSILAMAFLRGRHFAPTERAEGQGRSLSDLRRRQQRLFGGLQETDQPI